MTKFPLSERVNALFDTFHTKDEPETSTETAVAFLNERGHNLVVEDLERLRSGGGACDVPPELINDIASFFHYPPEYLTASDEGQRFKDLHEQLDTLRVLRQQGVKRVRFRSQPKSSDRAALIRALQG